MKLFTPRSRGGSRDSRYGDNEGSCRIRLCDPGVYLRAHRNMIAHHREPATSRSKRQSPTLKRESALFASLVPSRRVRLLPSVVSGGAYGVPLLISKGRGAISDCEIRIGRRRMSAERFRVTRLRIEPKRCSSLAKTPRAPRRTRGCPRPARNRSGPAVPLGKPGPCRPWRPLRSWREISGLREGTWVPRQFVSWRYIPLRSRWRALRHQFSDFVAGIGWRPLPCGAFWPLRK